MASWVWPGFIEGECVILQEFGDVRPKSVRFAKKREGFLGFVFGEQRGAEVAEGIGVLGIDGDGGAKRGNGFVGFPEVQERGAQAILRFGKVLVLFERLPVGGGCLFIFPFVE